MPADDWFAVPRYAAWRYVLLTCGDSVLEVGGYLEDTSWCRRHGEQYIRSCEVVREH